jgi:hypothetical protein
MITAHDIPTTLTDRLTRGIAQTVNHLTEPGSPASKEESVISGTRFTVGGCTVRIDAITIVVTRGANQ